MNNVAARLTTFLDLLGNDNRPERVDVTVRLVGRVVKYLFVERPLVVAVRDTETVERELFVFLSFDVSRVRTETVERDTVVFW